MNTHEMKQSLGSGAVLQIGGETTAYAQYFHDPCYLPMLYTGRV